MRLQEYVAQAFDSEGSLARLRPSLRSRPGQVEMARQVAQTVEDGGILVVEAGTGVGKTYAYLVPVLLSGQRALVSTATKTLQDQLFSRDIPRLLDALGLPIRVALLKGRGSYLCKHRLLSTIEHCDALTPHEQRELLAVDTWSRMTASGDLAEIPDLEDSATVVAWVTSTRDNCLGSDCPQASSCHVNSARRAAMAADVVVVNHHLFFADMQVRESGVAELLPTVNTVVFDEAHQVNDIGIQFSALQWTSSQLCSLCSDLIQLGPHLALASVDWRSMVLVVEQGLMALCNHFSEEAHGRRAWDGAAPLGIDATHWSRLVEDVVQALRRAAAVLNPLQEHSPEFRTLYQRCEVQADQLSMFNQSVPDGMVRWLELGASLRILQSPMHIAQTMRAYLQNWNEKDSLPGGRSWIFTSATLGHDAALGLFIETCGLEGARVLQVDSPFNYALQGAVYVPEHLPLPAHALHSDCVALLVSQGAEILGGRTLVLTTTLRAMRSIGDALKSNLLLEHGIEVLVQGQMSKRELVERFCQAGKGSAPGAVLVACASFWEGIDVPGEDLQLVVIDKLPFSPPDDPLVEARSRYLELIGKKPFQHLHVPQAVLALKQGAGRLIRSETDQGVLVICDTRLLHKGYGRRMLAALPPMKRLVDYTEFIGALQGLTRTSTTNPDPL